MNNWRYKETPLKRGSYQTQISPSWLSLRGKFQYWASKTVPRSNWAQVTSQIPLLSSLFIYSRQVQATSFLSGGTPWIIDTSFLTASNTPCKWCLQAFKQLSEPFFWHHFYTMLCKETRKDLKKAHGLNYRIPFTQMSSLHLTAHCVLPLLHSDN